MTTELSDLADYSKMSILNLFSPKLNHKNRRKPAPRLALSPFVHFFNAQQMLKMLKLSGEILETKTTITLHNCGRGSTDRMVVGNNDRCSERTIARIHRIKEQRSLFPTTEW